MWRSSGRHKHNHQICDVSKSLKNRVFFFFSSCFEPCPDKHHPRRRNQKTAIKHRGYVSAGGTDRKKERDSRDTEEEIRTNKMRECRNILRNTEAGRETGKYLPRGKTV